MCVKVPELVVHERSHRSKTLVTTIESIIEYKKYKERILL